MSLLRQLWRRLAARSLYALLIPTLVLAACSTGGIGSTTGSTSTGGSTQVGGADACAAAKPSPTGSGDLGTPITGGTLSGSIAANTPVHLNIALNINRTALDACLKAIYDPASANYRKFLNPSDIADRFAPSAADVDRIKKYLTDQGLTISQTYYTNAAISADGRADAVQKAFKLQLQQYTKKDGTYFAPDKAPTLPTDIQGLIASISGLTSNTPIPCAVTGKCGFIRRAGGPVIPTNAQLAALPTKPKTANVEGDCTLAPIGLGPLGGGDGSPLLLWSDLRNAYGLTNLASQGFDGGTTAIGMVEFDPYLRGDVVNYMLCAGTYGPDRLVNIDVVPGLLPGAGVGEATLDVEMAAGMTGKNTKIITYNAPNNAQWQSEFQDILHRVASDKKVSVLSISYGDFEQDLTPTYRESVNETMKLLAAEGISTFVASGDCGAFGAGQYGANVVDFPASAPWAIAVGGTKLSTDAVTGNPTAEVVWGNTGANLDKAPCSNTWGTGGGLSGEPSFTTPSWQKGPGVKNQYSNGARQVPDVAAAAINISIYYSGVGAPLWLMTGGTSAAAPIWAAGMDVVNQALVAKGKSPMGGVPMLYQLANQPGSKNFNDITSGNNLYYPATAGWDFTTGWGSPHFDQIAAALGA